MQVYSIFREIEGDLKRVENYLLDHVQAGHKLLQESFIQLLQAGGKRIRPAFALLSARYGPVPKDKLIPLAAALELIHMASLVHDDVIDSSKLRRGKPTIKSLYGNNFSLHSGDFLLAQALTIIDQYKNNQINNLLARVSVEMCQGEIEQIASAFNFEQDLRNYFYRIKRKTSLLIAASCQAGAIGGGASPGIVRALGRYGHNIGMAFQITDDVLDFVAEEKVLGKPVGSDLRQGIITLPIIFVLKQGDPKLKQRLLEITKDKALSTKEVEEAISIVKKAGAIDFSLQVADKYIEKALKELNYLPPNSTTESLHQLALFVRKRQF